MNPAADYILSRPEPYRSMLLHLQQVIEGIVPEAELKFKYRIPFYYVEGKPFCYLNQSRNYVDLGFWNAAHLTRHLHLMVTEGRKVMRSLRYTNLEEIDNAVLIEVLKDAFSVRHKKFYK